VHQRPFCSIPVCGATKPTSPVRGHHDKSGPTLARGRPLRLPKNQQCRTTKQINRHFPDWAVGHDSRSRGGAPQQTLIALCRPRRFPQPSGLWTLPDRRSHRSRTATFADIYDS
jgi:hypothetical protein